MLTKVDLEKGKNLKETQKELYKKMENYPAFLFLIKTGFDKLIATFIHSKFENTEGMKYERYSDCKETKHEIWFYLLENELVTC